MFKLKHLVWVFALIIFSFDAQAYVGPGLGAGTIGVILGLLASILLAIFAIFWYPIKRLIKKKGSKSNLTSDTADADSTDK
jgi:hypothetical protein